MRQEATGSVRRIGQRLHPSRYAVCVLLSGVAAFLCITSGAGTPVAAEPRGLYRVLTAKLPIPVKHVAAITCPGVAPSEMVRWPQRPGTPDPSTEAPRLPVVMVVDKQNHRSRIRLDGDGMVVEPLGNCNPPPAIEHPDQLDGSVAGVGSGFIAEAWLAVPTLIYRHGILGDVVTAAELRATNRQGDMLRYRLPDDSVLEDRWARMVYVDRQDAVLVVESGLTTGSSLALFGLDRPATDAHALVLLAASDPFGAPHKWLNPVGVADFDGNGHDQIAAVLTPHVGGTLAIYERKGAKLVERYHAPGFSNHRIYTSELGMSAIVDANGDGIMDLAVPSADRMALRVVTFSRGRFTELQRIPHESKIDTAIAVQRLSSAGYGLVYALEDGTVVVLTK